MSDVYAEPATAGEPTDPATLARYTTLRLGGPAGRLETAEDATQIVLKVQEAEAREQAVLVLAGGSNVVIGDQGFPGTVVLVRSRGAGPSPRTATPSRYVSKPASRGRPRRRHRRARLVRAGVPLRHSRLGRRDPDPERRRVRPGGGRDDRRRRGVRPDGTPGGPHPAADCGFVYRGSIFKYSDRWVVLTVDFRLTRSRCPARSATPNWPGRSASRSATGCRSPTPAPVRKLRAGKGMVLDPADPDTWSVGSFFTNPVLPGEVFEQMRERAAEVGAAALAGCRRGGEGQRGVADRQGRVRQGVRGPEGVAISSKHTLALTNRSGTASTAALVALAREIRDGVQSRFGVTLHPEPVLINCTI
ncbi:UDP-N-acetylenolpyruvoylglucosamine reductase [Micromonospora sp. BRA006-A]|nr:UDP-N-acetylenolpyruvoylglucosamine reductase [Micromonospora sp. BRA006-A]